MHRVDPSRLDLAREFKSNPTGPHSPELQKLLKLLRWEPLAGRFVVVQPRPGWSLVSGAHHRTKRAPSGDFLRAWVHNVGGSPLGPVPQALGTAYWPGTYPGSTMTASIRRVTAGS